MDERTYTRVGGSTASVAVVIASTSPLWSGRLADSTNKKTWFDVPDTTKSCEEDHLLRREELINVTSMGRVCCSGSSPCCHINGRIRVGILDVIRYIRSLDIKKSAKLKE